MDEPGKTPDAATIGTPSAAPRRRRRTAPPPALADQAVTALRRMIARGMLAPGARLFEPVLSETLGVSRTPVREALKLLAAEGLVELRRNRNALVAPLDPAELRELFEVESCIEGYAAGLAAERIGANGLRRLRLLQERMESRQMRGDLEAYFEINQQIHRLVVASAGNAVLRETHERLIGRLERARFFALGAEGRWEESVLEHRAILRALENRDAAAAQRLFTVHVRRTGEVVAETCQAPAVSRPERKRA